PGWWMASDGRWYPPHLAPGAVPAPPVSPAAVRTSADWAAFGCSVAVVAGSFMPWVDAGFISAAGTEGDGMLTLVLGAIAVFTSLVRKSIGTIVAMALVVLIAGYDVANISTMADDSFITVSPGMGLILVLLAGIGAIVAAAVARGQR